MAMKVFPVPQLPNVARLDQQVLQSLVTALVRELISHATRLNVALTTDGADAMTAPLALASYATGDLPDATAYEGAIVYDTTTNTVKWSNGTVWATI